MRLNVKNVILIILVTVCLILSIFTVNLLIYKKQENERWFNNFYATIDHAIKNIQSLQQTEDTFYLVRLTENFSKLDTLLLCEGRGLYGSSYGYLSDALFLTKDMIEEGKLLPKYKEAIVLIRSDLEEILKTKEKGSIGVLEQKLKAVFSKHGPGSDRFPFRNSSSDI
ncbi:hypothetical protein CULT_1520002 [[Clostridium] ultunense Esp]|nr:hypothetical protein CULT_1520002 [[Clostridium] ultunense Esp]